MNNIPAELILYNYLKNDDALSELASACDMLKSFSFREANEQRNIIIEHINKAVLQVVTAAERFSFSGDAWKNYITLLIVGDENPFSLLAEGRKLPKKNSVYKLALKDAKVLKQIYDYDFSMIEKSLSIDYFSRLKDYTPSEINKNEDYYCGKKIMQLSENISSCDDAGRMLSYINDFYKENGVGIFGLYKAFRISNATDAISLKHVSVNNEITLDSLVGYERQKEQLRLNTKAFIKGKPANDVLIYGDNGTGKSTSIKAILNEFSDEGLRLVEINKYQFKYIPALFAEIKDRNYKFIIFIDDLSFEEDENEFKFLKSAIEGDVEARPSNVLIYATSNRRHLIKEIWDDRKDMEHDGDIHHSDTVEEKISLSSRFGMAINFSKPNKKGYEEIVKALAQKEKIKIDEETLLAEAEKWELRHGGFTGRVAKQFINYIAGTYNSK